MTHKITKLLRRLHAANAAAGHAYRRAVGPDGNVHDGPDLQAWQKHRANETAILAELATARRV